MRKFLILVRDRRVQRDLGRVLGAKERMEAEERAAEEADNKEDENNEDEGGGPTVNPWSITMTWPNRTASEQP